MANEVGRPALSRLQDFRATVHRLAPQELETQLNRLWGAHELPEDNSAQLPRGCTPYLPCPAATVREALTVANVNETDVFVDIGSGLGRAAALAHLCTGASAVGLEIQTQLVAAAKARADHLNLTRIRFLEGDALKLLPMVPAGTVYFLYCPFGGPRLQQLLDQLETRARLHEIRICCVDLPPLENDWLKPLPLTSIDLAVYRSRAHG